MHLERMTRKLSSLFRDRLPLWDDILSKSRSVWEEARADASGERVLIGTSLGGYDHAAVLESSLAVALTMRGAQVNVLLCDGILPACQFTKIAKISPENLVANGQKNLCRACMRGGNKVFNPLGLKVIQYGDLLGHQQLTMAKDIATAIPLDEIQGFKYEGISVGEHAYAGTLRFFARGDLDSELLSERVLRLYLEASLLSVFALQSLMAGHDYDVACFHHGIYVPQGLIGEVCRKEEVRVVTWNPAYRKQTFIFSHHDSYHHTMITESISEWADMRWGNRQENAVLDYLKSRWTGENDWIWFHEKPEESMKKIADETGIDFSKPCIGLLTNVMWDAQLHYKSNAFKNMLEWVIETITHFAGRPDLQLVIRVHPAELRGMIPSRQPLVAEIRRLMPSIPSNVFIIPPESQISTYAVMEKCNSVIIYNTKTGIEISSMGIPVIVAGEAWIRNKGFSIDASSPEEYFRILDSLPFRRRLTQEELTKARKYAFHFFFRRMIPLPFIGAPEKFKFSLELSDIKELLPQRHAGLDVICEGILAGKPFVHRYEDVL